jgi:hypothetical protein
VEIINCVLYKLDDLVRPYVHKILVVIEPLLIGEDYYARVERREITLKFSSCCTSSHSVISWKYAQSPCLVLTLLGFLIRFHVPSFRVSAHTSATLT